MLKLYEGLPEIQAQQEHVVSQELLTTGTTGTTGTRGVTGSTGATGATGITLIPHAQYYVQQNQDISGTISLKLSENINHGNGNISLLGDNTVISIQPGHYLFIAVVETDANSARGNLYLTTRDNFPQYPPVNISRKSDTSKSINTLICPSQAMDIRLVFFLFKVLLVFMMEFSQ
ncbi:MAG: hypothetical protein ACRCSV_05900 [Chlamydiales bacterium]